MRIIPSAIFRKKVTKSTLALVTVLSLASLTACGAPSPDTRPSDSTLVTGINLLISTFDANHPKLVTWDAQAVKAQIAKKLPAGIETEAGWLLQWPHVSQGELSEVIVPWTLIGQYPNRLPSYYLRYKGGTLVPQSTSVDLIKLITQSEMQGDQYFGAVVDLRQSTVNSQWIIFSTVPYLPVTDPAYGFVTVQKSNSGSPHWAITDFGTALVGCGTVPSNVESEFGFQCQK